MNPHLSFIPENKFLLKISFLWAGGYPPKFIDHFLTSISIITPYFVIIPIQIYIINHPESKEVMWDYGFKLVAFYMISIRQLFWIIKREQFRILLNKLQTNWEQNKLLLDNESTLAIKKTQTFCRTANLCYGVILGLIVMLYPMLPIFRHIIFVASSSFPNNYTMELPYKMS